MVDVVNKTSGGSVTRTVTYYPAAGAMRINSTLYYILKDHLGSASVVTDANGNIPSEMIYMNKIIYCFLIITLLFATTSACASESSQIHKDDNLKIEITYLNGSSISPTGDLDLVIRNTTSNCIKFPVCFGIKVFVVQDKKIKEIPNPVTYIGNEPITLGPKGEISASALIYVKPDTSGLTISEPIDAYITISGHFCDNESHMVEEKIPFIITP
jgi:hypothetical protein